MRRQARSVALLVAAALSLSTLMMGLAPAGAAEALLRVNAGGASLSGSPVWGVDTKASPSPYVNASAMGNRTSSTSWTIATDPSVPEGTPAAMFSTERWDPSGGAEMAWAFPVVAGQYEVRLYFAETYSGTSAVGARVFDVMVEGALVLDDYDIFADVGSSTGVMKSFAVSSDGTLNVDFRHVVENPSIRGIEIVPAVSSPGHLGVSPSAVDFGSVTVGSTGSESVTLTNTGGSGDPAVVVSGTSIAGVDTAVFADSFDDAAGLTLSPGQSTTVTVSFAPTAEGTRSASLDITHDGTNSPVSVSLAGTGGAASTAPSFGKGSLGNEVSSSPTSLQFGPDGRLYVAQFNGMIYAYDVTRNGANDYVVTSNEPIDLIAKLVNHDDNGSPNTSVNTRIITGILATGTATHPRLYVTSSDPRIGGGSSGQDKNLDTNSSMVSRLDWNGSAWVKLDLVRGLPRSEENHSANGMQLDSASNTLYIAQGGNTNAGGPSNNFALLPEVALSAAVLAVDLDAIGETTYDLPTLDDEARPGTADTNDPFGGNDGKNQARLVPGGPVQVHAPGFRNPYDLLLHSNGSLYVTDNGGNAGWGGPPVGEGPDGTCTNDVSEPGASDPDSLHRVSAAGYYGGHPNPTRGNTANTFNADGQSPVPSANAVECDYIKPGSADHPGLTTWTASTNGLDEYTASNFSGAMRGDILTAGYSSNAVSRVELDSTGENVTSNSALFSTVGKNPLDLTAQGDDDPFPGTVWVADMGGVIHIFEPADYDSDGGPVCTGQDSNSVDEDGDGFTNADEIDNGTDPCSAADVPPDSDGDKISDLNDPDDDNDGRPDISDAFAVDAVNGTGTTVPVSYTWDNGAPPAGGLLGLGFTGLMTNGTSDYLSLYDPTKMTAGGAAGATTVDEVPPGSATGAGNDQAYAFQFGINVPAGAFTAHTRLLAPFAGLAPVGGESLGLFIGTGGQDDFVELSAAANSGATGLRVRTEVAGSPAGGAEAPVVLPGPDVVDLYLTVDPAAGTVQAAYALTTEGVAGPVTALGAEQSIPSGWLASDSTGLAVGIISTSQGGVPFPATWDLVEVLDGGVLPEESSAGQWRTLASTGLARQEVSYVKADGRFFLAGGGTAHQAYDPSTDTWTDVAPLPADLDHIQGAVVGNLIYYIGGLEAWPSPEVTTVYIYDPATDSFSTGSPMPRGRGAGGVAVHDGKVYYAGGLHDGSAVAWFDVYDPAADSWTALPDMPRPRDHFQAAVVDGIFYAIGGRNAAINATTTANDAFDLTTSVWRTGLAPLPTARGGFASAVLGSEILVIGGEGGGNTWAQVEAYDTGTDSWRELAPMTTARHGIQAVVCAGSVYIAAGSTKQGSGPTDVHDAFAVGQPQQCTE